ncbi:MAG: hypothetical protein RMK93_08570, partial [Bacteroidota bacterium]|nr:hypothetical protein [Bacteroidota bacterium]
MVTGSVVRRVLLPQNLEPPVDWGIFFTVPYDGIEFSAEELDYLDMMSFLDWCKQQSYNDPILGETQGTYVVNLAPIYGDGPLNGSLSGEAIAQFLAYERPDGTHRILYAPRRGLLHGYGDLIKPIGVGHMIVIPDIYNGNYCITTEKTVVRYNTAQGTREEEREVLVCKGLTGGEFPAPHAFIGPIFEGEEYVIEEKKFLFPKPIEGPLGLVRFTFEKKKTKRTSPQPVPYYGSPHIAKGYVNQEPPATTLLKFWEICGIETGTAYSLGENIVRAPDPVTFPAIWVDKKKTYHYSNASSSEFVDVTSVPVIDTASDLYRWEDVRVKYYPVSRIEDTLLYHEIERESIGRGVAVRTRKKSLSPLTAARRILAMGRPVDTTGNPVQPDYGVPQGESTYQFPYHYVRPIDLVYGEKKLDRKRSGPRRTSIHWPEGEEAYLPITMWNYRLMWEYDDGSFSAVSHPIPCYDLLWSAASDAALLEMAIAARHIATLPDGVSYNVGLGQYIIPQVHIYEPHLVQSRPWAVFRAPWDVLRSLVRFPIKHNALEQSVPFTYNVTLTSEDPLLGSRQLNAYFSSPPIREENRDGRISPQRITMRNGVLVSHLLNYFNEVFLPLKKRLYPSNHRFAQAPVLTAEDFLLARPNSLDCLESLVCMTAFVEGDGILFDDAIVADIATHEGEVRLEQRTAGPVFKELTVELKHKDVAKLVVPVFPRPQFPGWQKTLCTERGYLRLPLQVGGRFFMYPPIVPEPECNFYRYLPNYANNQRNANWLIANPNGYGPYDINSEDLRFYSTQPHLNALADSIERGYLGHISKDTPPLVPSALLVFPGRYCSASHIIHCNLGTNGQILGGEAMDTLHRNHDADFLEAHATDGIWLNIITAYDIRYRHSVNEKLFEAPGLIYPTQLVVVRSQSERLDYTVELPPEVRDRVLVQGQVELSLVQPGMSVGLAPEWSNIQDGKISSTVTGHRLSGELHNYDDEYTVLEHAPVTLNNWYRAAKMVPQSAYAESADGSLVPLSQMIGDNCYLFIATLWNGKRGCRIPEWYPTLHGNRSVLKDK